MSFSTLINIETYVVLLWQYYTDSDQHQISPRYINNLSQSDSSGELRI